MSSAYTQKAPRGAKKAPRGAKKAPGGAEGGIDASLLWRSTEDHEIRSGSRARAS